jgi:TrmH family RNA methyltransferase
MAERLPEKGYRLNEITSVTNQKVKDVASLHQRKYRNREGLFLIEGEKGIKEALECGVKLESVFIQHTHTVMPGWLQVPQSQIGDALNLCPYLVTRHLNQLPDSQLYSVTEPVMKKLSTTDSPPTILAVAHQPKHTLKEVFNPDAPLVAVLENIKDPGNLGTIIRTACACGVSGIILADNTVDVYNPKTVRASVGNLWKIPIVHIEDKKLLKSKINSIQNCQFLATVVKEDSSQKLFF